MQIIVLKIIQRIFLINVFQLGKWHYGDTQQHKIKKKKKLRSFGKYF